LQPACRIAAHVAVSLSHGCPASRLCCAVSYHAVLCCAEEGVALRGLFIIDKEGVVQHSTINNLAFGRNVDETLRILQVRIATGSDSQRARLMQSPRAPCQDHPVADKEHHHQKRSCVRGPFGCGCWSFRAFGFKCRPKNPFAAAASLQRQQGCPQPFSLTV
jgi:hypothetical protein